MEYTLDTEIEFYASLGFIRVNREKAQTLRELGLDEEDLEDMSKKEIEEFVDDMHEEWLSQHLDSGWQTL